MNDFEARHIIEALRSGVSSRAASQYFSSARPQVVEAIESAINNTARDNASSGRIILGNYGEGKTHLLNTAFYMAQQNNMVVSLISLSKETPLDKLHLVFQKLINNTYLPDRLQPGFKAIFEDMAKGSALVSGLQEYALSKLETNKLYYLLKSYLGTEDYEEKFMLLADIEGDIIGNDVLKRIYKRIYEEKVSYNINFGKTKHIMDYFSFLSHLFIQLGYNGWVILFDEAELIGGFGKKARQKAYKNIWEFLSPNEKLESVYSIFTFTASFIEEIIEKKHELDNLDQDELSVEDNKTIKKVLNSIISAQQLAPLTNDEIMLVLTKIQEFHSLAYGWDPNINLQETIKSSDKRVLPIRTRIRAAIEFLDQLYQYGQTGSVIIGDLNQVTFDEESEVTSLEELI